jgi:Na+/H+-dicarboxylate symporter
MNLTKLQRFSSNPWTILSSVILGALLGWAFPLLSKSLSVIGEVYIDLLKMIVLPFMFSAIIFSLQKLLRDGHAGEILRRLLVVITLISVAGAVLASLCALTTQTGSSLSPDSMRALGKIVGADSDRSNSVMALKQADEPPKVVTLKDILGSLIPTNIFASLANGETLKALVFALLFGLAVGQVPGQLAKSLEQSLETVYQACQTLTRYMNLPIPAVLVCLTAAQIAETGFEPLVAMRGFVFTFLLVSGLILLLSIYITARRANCTFTTAWNALHDAFSIGVATNNSATCMPAMVEGLIHKLSFPRSRVELLVPFCISLLRVGPIAYFVCATLFIAGLYGRQLSLEEMVLVAGISVLSGFASVGMSGILTISLIATACSYLGLPFEASFILFVAVDSICAMARTAVTVIGSCAAVALICPHQSAELQPI